MRPINTSQFIGEIPEPGLLEVILDSVNTSPFSIGLDATSDLRAISLFGISLGVAFLIPSPKACWTV